jgi:FkbM family methyltransferase
MESKYEKGLWPRAQRLAIAALIGMMLCGAYFYLFEQRKAYATYRCITAAQPWYACFLSSEFSFRTDLFGLIYEGSVGKGDYVDEMILTQGAYETHVLFFLRDTMAKINARDGVFLDVGANSGQHSLFMSRYAKSVHAFEPYPPVLARFRRMLDINAIKNVTIHPLGLGREAARLPFDDKDLAFVEASKSSHPPTMELEIVPGDEALMKAGVDRIDLVKMDIEGFEKPALLGLSKTLRRDRPVVVFELTINPQRPGLFSSAEDVRAAFPKDYEFLVFSRWVFYTGFYELVDMQSMARFDTVSTYNAVAYPKEKKAALALISTSPQP